MKPSELSAIVKHKYFKFCVVLPESLA